MRDSPNPALPVAWEEARKVKGIHVVDERLDAVTIENGDERGEEAKLPQDRARYFVSFAKQNTSHGVQLL